MTAQGGVNGAGIGGGSGQLSSGKDDSGCVTIYDGDVTAKGGEDAAGLGGGDGGHGVVFTMYGGKLDASTAMTNSKQPARLARPTPNTDYQAVTSLVSRTYGRTFART